MKLLDYFAAFLKDTVNLDERRLDLLESRVESIVAVVGLDETIGAKLIEHIPQGSWAHRTIIKPLPGKEFDADILLHLEEDEDWSLEPRRYVDELYAAFKRSSLYGDKVERKNRCVRVVYADDCHVDVVPYLVRSDDDQVIVNREANAFEPTNPTGFTAWMREKDADAGGNLRKVIRLIKYLRDYKGTFSCPSVILTTLVGQSVSAFDAATKYGDVPTTLKSILGDLDSWLQLNPSMPTIEDPSCPGTTFNHRWDQDRYANFRDQIHRYAGWVREALEEQDRDKSLAAWQKVFGPDFKAPSATAVTSILPAPAGSASLAPAPQEQFIENMFPVALRYRARIDGRVLPRNGFRSGPIRNLGALHKGRSLRFKVRTDTPGQYELYWKVRNTGAEATSKRGLRGEIVQDDQPWSEHSEITEYSGAHWIECFVVKGGVVVASDRYPVVIA